MKFTVSSLKSLIREAYSEGNLTPDTQVLRDNLREQGVDVHPVDQPYWADDVINALQSPDPNTRQLAIRVWQDMDDGYTMLRSKFAEIHKHLTVQAIMDLMQRVLDSIDTAQIREPQEIEPEAFQEDDPDFPDDLPTTLEMVERSRDVLHLCRQYIDGNVSLDEVVEEADEISSDDMLLDNYGMLTDEADVASSTVYHTVNLLDHTNDWKQSLQSAVRFLSDTVSSSEMASALKARIAEKLGI